MANQFIIEIYKEKNPEEFTNCLADPNCRMQPGSAAASTASYSAAIAKRVTEKLVQDGTNDERIDYLRRNTEIVRKYMIHLIDEDVKSRGPLRRALKEGGDREIEAGLQTSASINNEIISMMRNFFDLIIEIGNMCDPTEYSHIKEAAILARAAASVCREENITIAYKSIDDTYSYVLKRENELMMEQINECCDKVLALGY